MYFLNEMDHLIFLEKEALRSESVNKLNLSRIFNYIRKYEIIKILVKVNIKMFSFKIN